MIQTDPQSPRLSCAACGDAIPLTTTSFGPAVDSAAFAREHPRCLRDDPHEGRQGGPADRRRLLIRQSLHRAHAAPHGLLRPLSESEVEYLISPLIDLLDDADELADRWTGAWREKPHAGGGAYPMDDAGGDDSGEIDMLVLRSRRDVPADNHRWTCGVCDKRVQWVAGAGAAFVDDDDEGRAAMTVWLSGYCRDHAADVRAELEAAAEGDEPTLTVIETALRPAQVRGWVGRMRKQIPDARSAGR